MNFDNLNVQGQEKIVWPPSFSLSRAYLDQLERNGSQAAAKIAFARSALLGAERLSGQARRDALAGLATQLHTDANTAGDATKAHMLANPVAALGRV